MSRVEIFQLQWKLETKSRFFKTVKCRRKTFSIAAFFDQNLALKSPLTSDGDDLPTADHIEPDQDFMSRFALGAAMLAAAALTACAPIDRRPPAPTARAAHVPRCDEASGEATMSSLAAARYFARVNLQHNLGTTRGYLAAQGVRRVRVTSPELRCQLYQLGGGFYRCIAVSRLCGR